MAQFVTDMGEIMRKKCLDNKMARLLIEANVGRRYRRGWKTTFRGENR